VQSFNAPTASGRFCGWLSGLVNLPPSAIKDAEGVGSCLQHFHVIECQPKALEFALANPEDGMFQNENAQRFLLSKGDAFYVPPGNMYRLENHSTSEACILSYVIIRPFLNTTVETIPFGCLHRLTKEYESLQKDEKDLLSNPRVYVLPLKTNFRVWHYAFHGPPATPYVGGLYWGKLIFPPNYPLDPPSLIMLTPNGRFTVKKGICSEEFRNGTVYCMTSSFYVHHLLRDMC
jgi:hypothetical protein